MKKIIRFLMRSGLLLYPFFVIAMTFAYEDLKGTFVISEGGSVFLVWGVPALLILMIAINNRSNFWHSKRSIGFVDFMLGKEPEEEDTLDFKRATYVKIPAEYRKKKPVNLAIGKEDDYICLPLSRDGLNGFCVGTPGSGKSTIIIGWLLILIYGGKTFLAKAKSKAIRWNFFCIDIKGEMYKKILKLDGKYKASKDSVVHVVEPSNRYSFGWDVFYALRGDEYIPDTLKLKVVTDLSVALIPETGDNPYFYVNARKIMTGVMFFYIEKGLDFIEIIQKITRESLDGLITNIVNTAEMEGTGIVLDKLKGFVGKKDNESLQDIESTLKQYLDVFSYPDIVYCLKDNPNRTSPRVLNDGKTSIDFAIEESMLSTYQPVFRLICMQLLSHVAAEFKESDDRITSLIIDEAKRIGKIDGLDDTLATARSKHTNIFLFFQDLSQFRDIYGKDKADSILNICELKMFLSGAGDKDTTEYLSEMVGQYIVESKSYAKKGLVVNGPTDLKYSEQHRHVITGKSLMRLREYKEMIIIYYGKYMRFKKLEYFKDRYLSPIAKEIEQYNDAHKND